MKKRIMTMKKRFLSTLIVTVLTICLLPQSAFAMFYGINIESGNTGYDYTYAVGTSVSIQFFCDSDYPMNSCSISTGALPAGLSITELEGNHIIISGVPTAVTSGAQSATISATNFSNETQTRNISFTITKATPSISGSNTISGAAGSMSQMTATATIANGYFEGTTSTVELTATITDGTNTATATATATSGSIGFNFPAAQLNTLSVGGPYDINVSAFAGNDNNNGFGATKIGTFTVTNSYMATITPDGKDFGSKTLGYSTLTPETFTITSTGTGALANLAVTLTGTNASSFTLDTTGTATSLDAAGGTTTSTTFTVKPNDNLPVGTYTASIKVNADNMTEIVKSVSIKVNPKPTYAVTLPTGTGYTLTPETGSTSPVTEGENYSFKITLDDNYKKDASFTVKANGTTLTATNDVYTIEKIASAQTVTIKGIVLKPADYSKVDTAISKIPTDLSNYTDASVKTLNDAKNAVVTGKNITEQTTVDNYATAIENAITALVYKDADYSKVDAAIAKIPADMSVYTDATVKALNDAKNAVITGKNITEQTTVDGWATAIEDAITALVYKDADYSKVDATIAKIPADLSSYTDASIKALNDVTNAVVRGKNITEQTTVDDYATAIEDAITALVYKDADYSKVDAAIAKIPADLSGYTDATVKTLNDAKAAVVTGKNITEQTTVDGYATAIENAITGLTKKPAATSPETNSPQTGDTSNMILWIALLFVSGAAVAVLGVAKKHKKANNK